MSNGMAISAIYALGLFNGYHEPMSGYGIKREYHRGDRTIIKKARQKNKMASKARKKNR